LGVWHEAESFVLEKRRDTCGYVYTSVGFGESWIDDVELILKNMGVKRWRTGALDRTEWASVMREATA
jgi:hypothetical protein